MGESRDFQAEYRQRCATRNEEVCRLKDEFGYTFTKIGTIMDITRQRAWQIYRDTKGRAA